jgi:hypothetical protein
MKKMFLLALFTLLAGVGLSQASVIASSGTVSTSTGTVVLSSGAVTVPVNYFNYSKKSVFMSVSSLSSFATTVQSYKGGTHSLQIPSYVSGISTINGSVANADGSSPNVQCKPLVRATNVPKVIYLQARSSSDGIPTCYLYID